MHNTPNARARTSTTQHTDLSSAKTNLVKINEGKHAPVKVTQVRQQALNVVQVLRCGLVLAGELGQLVEGLHVVHVLDVFCPLQVHKDLVLRMQIQKTAIVLLTTELDKV